MRNISYQPEYWNVATTQLGLSPLCYYYSFQKFFLNPPIILKIIPKK